MLKINKIDYTVQELEELFEVSGSDLIWKVSRGRISRGSIAGRTHPGGYRSIQIDGTDYYTHRLMWILCGNTLSTSLVIDHIDGDKMNNHIDNLQQITNRDNVLRGKSPKAFSDRLRDKSHTCEVCNRSMSKSHFVRWGHGKGCNK